MATASTLGPTATTFTDTSTAPLLCMPSDGGAIDPSPFVDPATGKAWLLWKSNDGGSTQPARIWSAQLSADGASFVTQPVQLMFNDTVDYPQMVVANGTYYLLFSGGIWDSSSYAQGYAVCAGPQGPCTQPQATPFLSSYGSVAGPGGGSLFSPDGTSWYLAYAAWTSGCTSYPSGGATSTCSRRLYVAPVDLPYQSPPTAPTGTGPPMVGVGATGDGQGYWMVDADGSVFAFGDASFFGSMGGQSLAAWMVGMAPTADNAGYWLVASDGGIFAFGDAAFFGSMGGHPLAKPVVGMAATPDGRGYWLLAPAGGIFAFGDAAFDGSMGGHPLAKPVVGMAATPDGRGYWLVASDGGIFAFGDAAFFGSMGGHPLAKPVVGMAATPDGRGYWLVASDGGIFAFGDAAFFGSMGGHPLAKPVVGMAATPDGRGYWLVAS